jgi:hypothetical protein
MVALETDGFEVILKNQCGLGGEVRAEEHAGARSRRSTPRPYLSSSARVARTAAEAWYSTILLEAKRSGPDIRT